MRLEARDSAITEKHNSFVETQTRVLKRIRSILGSSDSERTEAFCIDNLTIEYVGAPTCKINDALDAKSCWPSDTALATSNNELGAYLANSRKADSQC